MNGPRSQVGFTLIEVLVALSLTVVVLGALLNMNKASGDLTRIAMTLSESNEKADRAIVRLGKELRWARPTALIITKENGCDRIDFVMATGWDGTKTLWSSQITIRYEPSSKDTNGNGVADEGGLVRIRGGTRLVLCRNVQKGSFIAKRNGNLLDLQFKVFALSKGQLLESLVEYSEVLLNPNDA